MGLRTGGALRVAGAERVTVAGAERLTVALAGTGARVGRATGRGATVGRGAGRGVAITGLGVDTRTGAGAGLGAGRGATTGLGVDTRTVVGARAGTGRGAGVETRTGVRVTLRLLEERDGLDVRRLELMVGVEETAGGSGVLDTTG